MQSVFGVLPSNKSVIEGIPIPINIYIEPLSGNATPIELSETQIPRCSRCRAYLSSLCAISDDAWCCSVCSQIMHLSKPVAKEQILNNPLEVVEAPECIPLQHAIIVYAPVKELIRKYLNLLPQSAPLTVYTYTDTLHEIPTASVSEIVNEFDSIPFPTSYIPFNTASASLIRILSMLTPPHWCRIFIDSPPSGSASSDLVNIMKSLYEKEIRTDFFFKGTSYSELLTSIVKSAPGLSCVSAPFAASDEPPALFSEAKREFAFQLLAAFRSGVAFSSRFVESAFLASQTCMNYIRIPVLPARSAALTFQISPPKIDDQLRQQSMQCVVKFSRWNPKTNKISHLYRIISQDFQLSNEQSTVLSSVSCPLVFSGWLREAQKLPASKMSTKITENMKSLVPFIRSNPQMEQLVRMSFLSKSHPALSTGFWDRLTMGSLLSLSSPMAATSQFSFSVEIWKNDATLVNTVFSCDDKVKNGDYLFLIRSFPSLFLLSKKGEHEVVADSPLDKSIKQFIRDCEPLTVKFIQTQTSSVSGLLSVDDEDGLPSFLAEIGLPA